MQKVVILVPHPDDEVLGFGGIIQKHIAQNNNVHVMFVEQTSTEERYRIQAGCAFDSANLLGFNFSWINIESRDLLNINDKTISKVEEALQEQFPDILYIPHPSDTHQDHNAVFNIARVATRINGKAPIKQIYCGEIISSTNSCINSNQFKFVPTFYERLTKEQVDLKWEALSKYYLETKAYPHPRSQKGIYTIAQQRGMECGTVYAEAFECLRHINL